MLPHKSITHMSQVLTEDLFPPLLSGGAHMLQHLPAFQERGEPDHCEGQPHPDGEYCFPAHGVPQRVRQPAPHCRHGCAWLAADGHLLHVRLRAVFPPRGAALISLFLAAILAAPNLPLIVWIHHRLWCRTQNVFILLRLCSDCEPGIRSICQWAGQYPVGVEFTKDARLL